MDTNKMEGRIIAALKVLEDSRTKNQVRRAVHPERIEGGWQAFEAAWGSLLERRVVVSADTSAYLSKIGRRYWLAPKWMRDSNSVASNRPQSEEIG